MKEEKAKISVIMPTYNSEKYILQAIQSVLQQSYKNLELIIIDDCSTDNTKNIVLELLQSDSRIKYVKNEKNMGVSISRNLGVRIAQTDWIAFLDSDDYWKKDKLERQLQQLENHPEGEFFFSGSNFVDQNGKKSRYVLEVPDCIAFKQLLKQNVISCSSVLIKAELLYRYPMKNDSMHEDFAVWLQILKDGKKAYAINAPLLTYRLSDTSKSSDKRKAALMTWKVYRFIGLNVIKSLYYLCWYSIKSIIKYYNIRSGF